MAKLITVPDPVLRQVSKPVEKIDKKILQFIKDLTQTLTKKTDPPGVGLSAIQVGYPLRLFITNLIPRPTSNSEKPGGKPVVKLYINPKIISASQQITLGDNLQKPLMEGCLSIPRLWGPVWRHQQISVKYHQLEDNLTVEPSNTETLTGFSARVFQHELDHLNGILFTDYTLGRSPSSSFNPLGKPQPLYFEEEDEFVKIEKPQAILNW